MNTPSQNGSDATSKDLASSAPGNLQDFTHEAGWRDGQTVSLGQDRVSGDWLLLHELAIDASASDEARSAVLTAARAAAPFRHPAVLPVRGVEPDAGGIVFIQENPQGRPLSHVVGQTGPIPCLEALAWLRSFVDGLGKALDAGLLLPQISPVDFAVREKTSESSRRSLVCLCPPVPDGWWLEMEDPAFASPEQKEGKACGIRASMYSTGALFAWMVLGQCPPEGDSWEHFVTQSGLPQRIKNLLTSVLAIDPEQRTSTPFTWLALMDRSTESDSNKPRAKSSLRVPTPVDTPARPSPAARVGKAANAAAAPAPAVAATKSAARTPAPAPAPAPAASISDKPMPKFMTPPAPVRRKRSKLPWLPLTAGLAVVAFGVWWMMRPHGAKSNANTVAQTTKPKPAAPATSDESPKPVIVPAPSAVAPNPTTPEPQVAEAKPKPASQNTPPAPEATPATPAPTPAAPVPAPAAPEPAPTVAKNEPSPTPAAAEPAAPTQAQPAAPMKSASPAVAEAPPASAPTESVAKAEPSPTLSASAPAPAILEPAAPATPPTPAVASAAPSETAPSRPAEATPPSAPAMAPAAPAPAPAPSVASASEPAGSLPVPPPPAPAETSAPSAPAPSATPPVPPAPMVAAVTPPAPAPAPEPAPAPVEKAPSPETLLAQAHNAPKTERASLYRDVLKAAPDNKEALHGLVADAVEGSSINEDSVGDVREWATSLSKAKDPEGDHALGVLDLQSAKKGSSASDSAKVLSQAAEHLETAAHAGNTDSFALLMQAYIELHDAQQRAGNRAAASKTRASLYKVMESLPADVPAAAPRELAERLDRDFHDHSGKGKNRLQDTQIQRYIMARLYELAARRGDAAAKTWVRSHS